MVNYLEILRLRQEYSQRQVAASLHCSRRTISEVYMLADEKGLAWPLSDGLSNKDIRNILYSETSVESGRKMPDCEYIHKELAKQDKSHNAY